MRDHPDRTLVFAGRGGSGRSPWPGRSAACDDRVRREEQVITDPAVPAAPVAVHPRLYRSVDGRRLAGVAHGIATHLGVQPRFVRLGFLVLAFFNGFGLAVYVALWAVVPLPPGTEPHRDRPRRLVDVVRIVALGLLIIGVLLLIAGSKIIARTSLLLPLLLGGAGLAVLWRQADDAQRSYLLAVSGRITGIAGRPRRSTVLRVGGGITLVVSGVIISLFISGQFAEAAAAILPILEIVAGILLIAGPWFYALLTDLTTERRERIRSQERADLAAHLHDSVLQTLALIQRHADSPREVARLARGQERELRSWLYRPETMAEASFAAAVERVCGEVEDDYAVTVETVVVGDADVDDTLSALIQAAREALVNAAKHAGVAEVSLYAEVEPEQVTVFVRDRGVGFDLDEVPADRHGVAGSIVGRMERHGGRAAVRTTPGQGTEVELTMRRSEP
jgi:signal transduction histidine kinase/phage shock protein PspC (stress-responsive transcriptional regulator)